MDSEREAKTGLQPHDVGLLFFSDQRLSSRTGITNKQYITSSYHKTPFCLKDHAVRSCCIPPPSFTYTKNRDITGEAHLSFYVWDSSVMLKRSDVSQRLTDTSSFSTLVKVLFRNASGKHCRSASRARKLSDSRR